VSEFRGVAQFVKRIMRLDGTEMKVRAHGVGITNKADEVIKIAGIFREVIGT